MASYNKSIKHGKTERSQGSLVRPASSALLTKKKLV